MLRGLLCDELIGGVVGAAAIAVIEVAALGSWHPGLVAAVVALVLGVGLAVGGAAALEEWAIERLGRRAAAGRGVPAAAIRASASLIALVPVGRHLFDGGLAATLPGASSAPFWVPAFGYLGFAATLWLGSLIAERGVGPLPPRGAQAILGGAAAVSVIAIELANRRLYPSEYPAVHLFLIVASCTAAALALRLLAPKRRLAPGLRWRCRAAVGGAVLAALTVTLVFGLASSRDRFTLARRGGHGHRLSLLVRSLFDLDGDGYSAVLGGGDCDESDPKRNRGARDIPDNGVDEDCDGRDAAPPPKPTGGLSAAERRRWMNSEAAERLRAAAADAPLIVISVDALRADVLAPSPENRRAFPAISALLDESVWFRRAFAPAAGTDVSLSCLVSGRVDPFVPLETTLWEAAGASGRATHAVLPREILRWAPRTLLLRGIAKHDVVINDPLKRDVGSHATSAETTDRGLAALDRLGNSAPAALWVHYFDVHEHAQLDIDAAELAAASGASVTERRYRAMVRRTDRAVGRLVDGLRSRGLWDRAVVLLLADHGESLGEDPRLPDHHGRFVYQPLAAIPLAIKAPGAPPHQVDEPVSLIDVFPTLVDLLSLERPEGLDGVSLFLHLVPGGPEPPLAPRRPLPINESEQWGVVAWPHKLMVRPADNLVELYDLSRDPGEHRNLAADEPELVARLKELHHRFPEVSFDRTRAGRRWRERQARAPRRR